MVCCNEGATDVAKLLLQSGADSKVKNAAGSCANSRACVMSRNLEDTLR